MKTMGIFSVPRSGSTWLGQIFNSSPEVLYRFQPNFSYSFPHKLQKNSHSSDIEDFYEKLKNCKDPFVKGTLSISGKNNVEFQKESYKILVWKEVHYLHLARTLLENSNTKILGLVRSPLSVIASWITVPKEFDPAWDISQQWRRAELKNQNLESNYFGYDKWKEALFLFENLKKEYPQRFYLLSYNDLLKDKLNCIKKVFTFFGLKVTTQTINFLQQSSVINIDDAYSVFKIKYKDDQWQEKLPKSIIKEITDDPDFIELNKRYQWV